MLKLESTLKPHTSLIDLTPLVDVVFLLLIFFIITSDVLPLKSLDVKTPQIEDTAPAKTSRIVIVMDKNQVIYLGSDKVIVDLNRVQEALKGEIKRFKKFHGGVNPSIVLSIDKQVDYASFLSLFQKVSKEADHIRLMYSNVDDYRAQEELF